MVYKDKVSKQLKSAFTLVELLIVIVVIGILATISIVAYNGVRAKAADSVVQAEVNQMYKKGSMAGVENLILDPHSLSNRGTTVSWLNDNFKVSHNGYMPNEQYPLTATPHYDWMSDSYQGYDIAAYSASGKIFVATFDGGGVTPGPSTSAEDFQSIEEYYRSQIEELTAIMASPGNPCAQAAAHGFSCEDHLQKLQSTLERIVSRHEPWEVGLYRCGGGPEYAYKASIKNWMAVADEPGMPVIDTCPD